MSHSPAPWFDDGYRIYAATDDADKRNGRVIVEYKHVDDFNQADAPLLTAAPDLLAALQLTRDYLGWNGPANIPARQTLEDAVSAAIAKAEGR